MKKFMILVALFIAIPIVKAQKQEIKKAEQAVNSGNLERASSYLLQAKQIFAAADEETRALYYIVEAEMKIKSKEMSLEQLASISKSLASAKRHNPGSTLSIRIANIESNLKNQSARVALGEYTKQNFSEAASLYNVAYQSSRDTIHYFNAAQSHLLAKEYDQAFEAYRCLFYMGFTDAKIRYVATNSKTGKKEAFSSTKTRKLALEQRTHKKPEVVHAGSKLPIILRGATISSIEVSKKNEAIIIIDKTIAKAPKDKRLLNQVLHLYLQLDAKDRYQGIMDRLTTETPNDPNLYYNFGVSSAQNNDTKRAQEYYEKTLTLDSNHTNAKVNLTLLLLDQEQPIIEEMNNLGTSADDDKRYEELKLKRIKLYDEVIPYLESMVASDPKNRDWTEKLKSIHLFKGQDDKMITVEGKIDD